MATLTNETKYKIELSQAELSALYIILNHESVCLPDLGLGSQLPSIERLVDDMYRSGKVV